MAGVDDRGQTSQVLSTNAHNTLTTQLRVVVRELTKLLKTPSKGSHDFNHVIRMEF